MYWKASVNQTHILKHRLYTSVAENNQTFNKIGKNERTIEYLTFPIYTRNEIETLGFNNEYLIDPENSFSIACVSIHELEK